MKSDPLHRSRVENFFLVLCKSVFGGSSSSGRTWTIFFQLFVKKRDVSFLVFGTVFSKPPKTLVLYETLSPYFCSGRHVNLRQETN